LQLSPAGKFKSLRAIACNCPNFNCFWVCNDGDFEDITTYADRVRYEDYVGKSLEKMTCEEYVNVKLYYDWYDRKYYAAY
jgi:hypothetical protein